MPLRCRTEQIGSARAVRWRLECFAALYSVQVSISFCRRSAQIVVEARDTISSSASSVVSCHASVPARCTASQPRSPCSHDTFPARARGASDFPRGSLSGSPRVLGPRCLARASLAPHVASTLVEHPAIRVNLETPASTVPVTSGRSGARCREHHRDPEHAPSYPRRTMVRRPVTRPARSRPGQSVPPARRAPHRRAGPPRRAASARRRAGPDPRHEHPGPVRERGPGRTAHERAAKRPRGTEDRARDDQERGFPQDEPQDVEALGAERQPDPDLAAPAGDRIGRDAGQTDGGEHETEQTQTGERADGDPDRALESLDVSSSIVRASKRVSRGSVRLNSSRTAAIAPRSDLPRTSTVVPWIEALWKRATGIGTNAVAIGSAVRQRGPDVREPRRPRRSFGRRGPPATGVRPPRRLRRFAALPSD